MQQSRQVRAFTLAIHIMVLSALALPYFAAAYTDISDIDITAAIETELWDDNAVSANAIDLAVSDGIVTMKGTVDSLLAKERAEEVCEAIVGVRAIVNLIKVNPAPPRSDKAVVRAIEAAWLLDPATDAYEVEASARDGNVTLTGTVSSYAEKDLAEEVAKGVRGVKGVTNLIAVDYKVDREDLEIAAEVEARLKNDVRVDAYLIDVAVKQGEVTLSGNVGSLREKVRAGDLARVAGVKSVNTEDIEVIWWARDKMRRPATDLLHMDDEIKKAVEQALRYDPRVAHSGIDVEVSARNVKLTGVVDNRAARLAAEKDARNTIGVWRVHNNIKVQPLVPDDEVLDKRVAAGLLNNPYVERYNITIDAIDGCVFLSGLVTTSFEKEQATRVAERVKGVRDVVNSIGYRKQWTWKRDDEIREEVKDYLFWCPFIDERDIKVSVKDGIVTLTGMVKSWSEHSLAEENAFQAGAKDVINELEVENQLYGPYGPGYYAASSYRGPANH